MEFRIELTFSPSLKEEPIICELAKKFDVSFNIIEASFSTNIGWVIFVLRGSKEELKKSFDFLKKRGVTISSATQVRA